MTEQEVRNEALYLNAMKIARGFLDRGLITENEYCEFDTRMKARYSPFFGDLFPRNTLTFEPNRVMYIR